MNMIKILSRIMIVMITITIIIIIIIIIIILLLLFLLLLLYGIFNIRISGVKVWNSLELTSCISSYYP